jgi:hypothetical protein
LSEGWIGGEGADLGLGKVTVPGNLLNGFFSFLGLSISAGPLAGGQIGFVGGLDQGWIGLYVEGHGGPGAGGAGVYFNYGGK